MDEDLDYEAIEMINAFNMEEFLTITDDMDRKNGAFLIITDNQLIISYNSNYGKGLHYESTANALCEITGEEKDFGIIPMLYSECLQKFIMARLINEPGLEYFIFEVGDLKSITPNQFSLLKQFVEQYNDQIRAFSEAAGKPVVLIEIDGEEKAFKDLKPVEEYFSSIIDEDKTLPVDKIIIGNTDSRRGISYV